MSFAPYNRKRFPVPSLLLPYLCMRVAGSDDLAFYYCHVLYCYLSPLSSVLSTPTLLYLSLMAIYAMPASLSPSPSSSHIPYGMSLAPTLTPGVSHSCLSFGARARLIILENLPSPTSLFVTAAALYHRAVVSFLYVWHHGHILPTL